MIEELLPLLPYIDQTPAAFFGLLIWYEIKSLRKESIALLHRLDERVK